MNAPETTEAELKRLKPARPPSEFMARLEATRPLSPSPGKPRLRPTAAANGWWQLARWLAPVTAGVALIAALLTWWPGGQVSRPAGSELNVAVKPVIRLDAVQIDHRLVAAYDALAQMPGGEPVRMHCQEWMDEVVLRDSTRGIQIEQRTPRFEITSVSLDAY